MSIDRKRDSESNLATLRELGCVSEEEFETMRNETLADATKKMEGHAEGVFSVMPIPLCIADRFVIDGRPRKVVMATYERSVVAAVNKAAKMTTEAGGFKVEYTGNNVTYGQVLYDINHAKMPRLSDALISKLFSCSNDSLCRYGADSMGFYPAGPFTVFQARIHTGEAQGGRLVTKIMKKMASLIDEATGLRHVAAIVSNHSEFPVNVEAVWNISDIGLENATNIVKMQRWASRDPHRAVTHLKGIMNAVDAVCVAAGQDVQAIEAMARYQEEVSSNYFITNNGNRIMGFLRLPIVVGTIGGATQTEYARRNMRIMGIENARDLAAVAACAGLAANFAALYALVQGDLYGNLGR